MLWVTHSFCIQQHTLRPTNFLLEEPCFITTYKVNFQHLAPKVSIYVYCEFWFDLYS